MKYKYKHKPVVSPILTASYVELYDQEKLIAMSEFFNEWKRLRDEATTKESIKTVKINKWERDNF